MIETNKRVLYILLMLFIFCFTFIGCENKQSEIKTTNSLNEISKSESTNQNDSNTQDTNKKLEYTDGIYEGQTELTSEYYYGKAKVVIKDGIIKDVDFKIYDKGKGNERVMDESYGKEVFADQPQYQEQTSNELAGIEKYKSELIRQQELSEVDLISGATWSFRIFNEAVQNSLKKANK